MSRLLPRCPSDLDEHDGGPATFWGDKPEFLLATAVLARPRAELGDPVDVELLEDAVSQRHGPSVLRRYPGSRKDDTGQIERIGRR
jgi:hypothetical protein